MSVEAINTLSEAMKSLKIANEKLLDPIAKEFTGDMLKVTEGLIKWSQAQGGLNV